MIIILENVTLSNSFTGVTWCAHRNKKLVGYTEGGRVAVDNLEQAQAKCLRMGDGCSGVTKEPNNNMYTLRRTDELRDSEDVKNVSRFLLKLENYFLYLFL